MRSWIASAALFPEIWYSRNRSRTCWGSVIEVVRAGATAIAPTIAPMELIGICRVCRAGTEPQCWKKTGENYPVFPMRRVAQREVPGESRPPFGSIPMGSNPACGERDLNRPGVRILERWFRRDSHEGSSVKPS